MPHTAHADPHEPRTTAVALHPREAFGLRTHSSRNVPASTGIGVLSHAAAVPAPICAAPFRTHSWKSPRAGPRGAARVAEVPRGWGPHSTVSKGLKRKRGLRC